MNNEIKSLEAKRDELETRLAEVKTLIHNAYCDALNIHEGDIVRDGRDREFKVGKIEIWDVGQPTAYLYGFKRTKGGDFGERSQYIGTSWKKV